VGEKRGKDDGPPRLEDLAGRLLGSVLDLGFALWATARDVADFSVRAVRAAADALLDASLPSPGRDDERRRPRPGAPGGRGDGDESPSRTGAKARAEAGRAAADATRAPRPEGGIGTGTDPFSPPLPADEERDRLVAVERDPATLFAWWDVTVETRDRARAELDRAGDRADGEPRTVLRASIEGAPPKDIDLPPFATSGYVDRPDRGEAVELTLGLARGGRFAPLAGPFLVAARPAAGDRSVAIWRRVGSGGAEAVVPGAVPPDSATPTEATAPSREESDRLVELALGQPTTGSPPWPAGRSRGPDHGSSTGLPSSR